MKRVFAFSLAAFAGFVIAVLALGVVLHVHPARAGAPTGAGGSGDTNGDGMVDMSDAIFTLLYLFKGGPAPLACADSPELVGRDPLLQSTEAMAQPARPRWLSLAATAESAARSRRACGLQSARGPTPFGSNAG